MVDSLHRIEIAAPASTVYRLLTVSAGLRSWWTSDAVLLSREGYVNILAFERGMVELWLRVDAVRDPSLVEWTCVPGPRTAPLHEWPGTRIVARLGPTKTGCVVDFRHLGWQSAQGGFAHWNTLWGDLLHRLRDEAEGNGRGPAFSESPRGAAIMPSAFVFPPLVSDDERPS